MFEQDESQGAFINWEQFSDLLGDSQATAGPVHDAPPVAPLLSYRAPPSGAEDRIAAAPLPSRGVGAGGPLEASTALQRVAASRVAMTAYALLNRLLVGFHLLPC